MPQEWTRERIETMSREERAEYDAQMPDRVIRFENVRPNWELSPNCRIPEYERANLVYVGGGKDYLDWQMPGRTRKIEPVVPGENYSCVILLCPPGKGAPLHAHTTEETFIALSGRWAMYYGDDAQHEVIIDTWSAISFPGPVMRGFRNVSSQDAYLLSVLGGGAPPLPVLHPDVITAVEELGLKQSWKENHEVAAD